MAKNRQLVVIITATSNTNVGIITFCFVKLLSVGITGFAVDLLTLTTDAVGEHATAIGDSLFRIKM